MSDEKDPLRDALRGLPPLTPPPGFYDRVLKEAHRPRLLSGALPRVLATAAVVTVVVWATLDFQQKNAPKSSMSDLKENQARMMDRIHTPLEKETDGPAGKPMGGTEKKSDKDAAVLPQVGLAGQAAPASVANSLKKSAVGTEAVPSFERSSPLNEDSRQWQAVPKSEMNQESTKVGVARRRSSNADFSAARPFAPSPVEEIKTTLGQGGGARESTSEVTATSERSDADRFSGVHAGSLGNSGQKFKGGSPKEASLLSDWRGDSSGIAEPKTVLCQNVMEWENLWAEHAPGTVPPGLDFKKYSAVGVFAGTKSSGGHDVQIISILEGTAFSTILYRQTFPDPNQGQTMALTQPYHIRVFPRFSKPVRFRKLQ